MEFTQGVRFDALGLTEEVQRALKKKNIEESTPVQAGCIPPMREWKDVIAKAPTGTGKTFAFGIPIIEHIDPESEEVQAVIMAPTRELAMQITAELRDLAVFMSGIRVVCLYGGAPIGKQIDALKKKPQIVVATPGRLSDHMKRRTVRLDRVQTVVLDEADRMLDMGFIHDIRRILPLLPERRQTLFFSATMPESIAALAAKILRNPVLVTVTPPASVVETIAQTVHFAEKAEKSQLLIDLLSASDAQQVLVFSRTKHGADNIARMLKRAGIRSEAIHGNKSQGQRQRALGDFKSGKVKVMVATDIAARGIDVSELHTVINYDLPDAAETYVHRIGRTGRAGRSGVALTFCSQDEHAKVRDIQKLTGRKLETVSCTA